MASYAKCFIAFPVLSMALSVTALAFDKNRTSAMLTSTPIGAGLGENYVVRAVRSPKGKTKKPKPSGGEGTHHVPCSVTCTNKGHTPTCCAAHGPSGGKCVGEKAFCT
ncbi:hypothetical protein AAVH_36028 [Aphelenchoides avenae]|nr:hypothetical protein AAVH_36028 [Aphelenchus avenae]